MLYWKQISLGALLSLAAWLAWNATALRPTRLVLSDIPARDHDTFKSHTVAGNTLVFVPINGGMLHLARNLLCSLSQTSFNTSNIVWWTLDEQAEKTLASEGRATYRDPTLFSLSSNENSKGVTAAYRRMMKERPKFFVNLLSAGYNLLMLDADTVFWQSPLLLIPEAGGEEEVDAVWSTDARKFYQTHNAFADERRRGSRMPPVCNGIFWMRSTEQTVALWSDMLDIFRWPPPIGWVKRINFQDDQRGIDVLLNDGRAELVEPFPSGITAGMLPPKKTKTKAVLKVRLLDQTSVVNGNLLRHQLNVYDDNLASLRAQGRERIAAHFNWDTRELSKEAGARERGMYFLDESGRCSVVNGLV